MSQDNNYNELKSQIDEIKGAMDLSSSSFRLIYAAENFTKVMFLSGIFSLALPLLYQSLLWIYDKSDAIPKAFMAAFYALIAVCWFILIFIRTKVSIDAAKKIGLSNNIFSIVKSILSTKMLLAVIPFIIAAVIIPFKFSSAFEYYDYVPYIGICLGISLNFIGVLIHESEYTYCGLLMILCGLALLTLIQIPPHIAVAVVFAPSCFLFVFANKHIRK